MVDINEMQVPSGTVTFLFTDIEGSTRLLRQLGDEYADLLTEHHALLRRVVSQWDGQEIDNQGDGFFFVFHEARKAISAAAEIQLKVADRIWPQGVELCVRMGMHTGESLQHTPTGLVGMDIHRAARLANVGHGGQVLLSPSTVGLIKRDLPKNLSLSDLGKYRLKDLQTPLTISQLNIDGLDQDFPALKANQVKGSNLPAPLTSFIGREAEVRKIVDHLAGPARILSITGPGGTGKTRLAIESGRLMASTYEDGFWFVDLSPLTDASLLPSTVSSVLGVREKGSRSTLEMLQSYLANKDIVIIFDNFEHIIEGATYLVELLGAAPGLKCLITSRERLGLSGEQEFPLQPLSIPQNDSNAERDLLEGSEAVHLFNERARAIDPDFRMTAANSKYVAQICRRVDGLPLAIELAAARIRMFPPKVLAEHLKDRLGTLTGGPRDAPARQRTLKDTLEWSHSLLTPSEKQLFARLSIFAGGASLDAIRAICSDSNDVVLLEDLNSLIGKSMLEKMGQSAGEPRYRMLETIREFATECLESGGERQEIARRHAMFFKDLLSKAEASLIGPDTLLWLDRLEAEHDNIRSALRWSMDQPDEIDLSLKLVGASRFWVLRGYLTDGYAATLEVLNRAGTSGQPKLRARAALAAARLAYRRNRIDTAEQHYLEALKIADQIGEARTKAASLIGIGMVESERGRYDSVEEKFEDAFSIFEIEQDRPGMANAILNLGWAGIRTGDFDMAEEHLFEALEIYQELGDLSGEGFSLSGIGEVYLRLEEYDRAAEYLDRSLEIRSSLGDKWGMGATLGSLGWLAIQRQDWERADEMLTRSLSLRSELGDRGGIAWCLEKLAEARLACSQERKSAVLFGAAHATREGIGSSIDPIDQSAYERFVQSARESLGQDEFKRAWTQGETQPAEAIEALIGKQAPGS